MVKMLILEQLVPKEARKTVENLDILKSLFFFFFFPPLYKKLILRF